MFSEPQASFQETETGFTNIDDAMAAARAKYAATSDLVPRVQLQQIASAPEDHNVDERIRVTISSAEGMIVAAQSQLATPCEAPKQLTVEEQSDKAEWYRWGAGYRMAESCNDRWLLHNQNLFGEAIDATAAFEDDWVLILDNIHISAAPPSPRLEDMKGVSATAASWIAMSKARLREHMIRDAAVKPVLVIKPARGSVERTWSEGSGVGKFLKRALSGRKR